MDAVEEIGSGIRRIRDLCREYGVAAPVIEVSEHWVTTIFERPAGGIPSGAEGGRTSEGRPAGFQRPESERPESESKEPESGTKSAPSEAPSRASDEASAPSEAPSRAVGEISEPSGIQIQVLRNSFPAKTLLELMRPTGRTDRTKFRNRVLRPLLEMDGSK